MTAPPGRLRRTSLATKLPRDSWCALHTQVLNNSQDNVRNITHSLEKAGLRETSVRTLMFGFSLLFNTYAVLGHSGHLHC